MAKKIRLVTGLVRPAPTVDTGTPEQKSRPGTIVQRDFHASAAGAVTGGGELNLKHPVHVVTSETLGSGAIRFPSSYRHIAEDTSQLIRMKKVLKPTKEMV